MYYSSSKNFAKHTIDRRFTVPVRFLVENKERLNLLYTYLWMRKYAIDQAGYIPKSVNKTLSQNVKYRLIPQLIKLGWMESPTKLVSIQRILEKEYPNEHLNNIQTQVSYEFLKNKKLLKSYIFSLVEQYIIQGKHRAEKYGYKSIDRETKKLTRQRIDISNRQDLYKCTSRAMPPRGGLRSTVTEQELPYNLLLSVKYIGNSMSGCVSRISYSMMKEWGYSERTVARLRKSSLNNYGEREFIYSDEEGKSSYSRKYRMHIKYLPIIVAVPLTNIYYWDFDKRRENTTPQSDPNQVKSTNSTSTPSSSKSNSKRLITRKEKLLKDYGEHRRSILYDLQDIHSSKTFTTIEPIKSIDINKLSNDNYIYNRMNGRDTSVLPPIRLSPKV